MEQFYYFAYASNLDAATLESRLKSKPRLFSLAALPKYGFRFNFPNEDGSARANIVPSENETVYGLLYEVNKEDLDFFLNSEPGYDFELKEVVTKAGKIPAYTFSSPTKKEGIFPQESYWSVILKGASEHGLPKSYVSQIINRIGKIGY